MYLSNKVANVNRAAGLFLILMAALFPFLVWNDGYLIELIGFLGYYTSWDRALHFYYLYLCSAYAVVVFMTGLILVTLKD